MAAARAHRQVVPYIRVVFEEVLEPLGEAQLAAGVELGGSEGGDQRGHARESFWVNAMDIRLGLCGSAAQDWTAALRHGEAAFEWQGAADAAFAKAGVIPSSPSQGSTILPERAANEATWFRRM